MSKLQNQQHIEIELDMDELDLTDAKKKATYEDKAYVLENIGLKVSKQSHCLKEKEDAIIDALKYF